MLDAFIIGELRRREEREQNRAERSNRLELPLRYEEPKSEHEQTQRDKDAEVDRGVVVLDMAGR